MNICILGYDINPPWVEAVANLAFELSHQLIREGHSVHIVTSSNSMFPLEEKIEGVFIHRVPGKALLPYFFARELRKLHKLFNFDVIHIHNAIMNKPFIITLILLRKWLGVPMIGYICILPKISCKEFVRLLSMGGVRQNLSRTAGWFVGTLTPDFFVKEELNMVDRVVTSSNYLRKRMVDLGLHESKVETIYPFMDICKFVKNSNQAGFRKDMMVPEDTPIILFIGSSEPARIGVFLKAFSIVLKKVPLSKVILVSSYSQHFLNSIEQQGLKHAFVMLPQNIEINISGLMAESNVLVYPGFSGIVSADPPLAVIEAAVLGIPIVATNTGGISEVGAMIKNCSIVQVFDSKGMGNALIESLEEEGERHFISQTWNLFESKVATQKFILIYRNLVAENPSKSSKNI